MARKNEKTARPTFVKRRIFRSDLLVQPATTDTNHTHRTQDRHPHTPANNEASMTVDNSQVIVLQANAAPVAIPFDGEQVRRAAEESNACFFEKVGARIESVDLCETM